MTKSHKSKTLLRSISSPFYKTFDEVKDGNFDGLIITGAPVELLPFEEVEYWEELCEIMEWSKTHVHSTFHICWGAQAGLYYHYGVPKYRLPEKMFGVFHHKMEVKNSILFRGFDDTFNVPHSRHTTVLREDIEKVSQLDILASSEEAGIYAVATASGEQIFIMGHSEYDALTLEENICGTKTADLISKCLKIIIRATTIPRIPSSLGDPAQISCIPTGSTTSYTRLLLLILQPLKKSDH